MEASKTQLLAACALSPGGTEIVYKPREQHPSALDCMFSVHAISYMYKIPQVVPVE
jgi:hypothetical protein